MDRIALIQESLRQACVRAAHYGGMSWNWRRGHPRSTGSFAIYSHLTSRTSMRAFASDSPGRRRGL